MAALVGARKAGHLERDPQGQAPAWRERHRQLYQHDWVVYAKTPLGGPAQVLEYLSRYTHRTAISNERISSVNPSEVAFKVRADAHGGKRTVRLPGVEFVRRFLQHVLPNGPQAHSTLWGARFELQGGQARCCAPGPGDAGHRPPGCRAGPSLHGQGGQV